MSYVKAITFLFLSAVIFYSCVPYTYFPQTPQTPASASKELSIGSSEILLIPDFTASYSPLHHLSFNFSSDFDIPVAHAGFEAGVAYYDTLNTKQKFGIFGGYGATHFSLHKDYPSENGRYNNDWYSNIYGIPHERTYRSSDQTYQKIFLQPYIIISGETLSTSGGLKCNYLIYPSFSVTDSVYIYDPDQIDANFSITQYQKQNGYAFSFQPYITIAMGDEKWQGNFTYSYQWISSSNINEEYLIGKRNMFTFGFNRTFSVKKKAVKHTGYYQ